MAKLIITDELNNSVSEFSFTKAELRIGRSSKNDLVLPSKKVSSNHALIKRIGKKYLLTDLESTNGTIINGSRITEVYIKKGDVFIAGNFAIEFIDGDPESMERDSSTLATLPSSPLNNSQTLLGNSQTLISKPQALLNKSQSLDKSSYQTQVINQIVAQGDLEAQLAEKIQILETLYALGRTLGSLFNIDEIFEQIATLLFQVTPADRCAILVTEGNTLNPRLFKIDPKKQGLALPSEGFELPQAITIKVLQERLPLLSVDVQTDQRLNPDKLASQPIRSVMCAPLLGKNGVLGVIYVDKLDLQESFSAENLALLNAVSSHAAIAVDNAVAYEQLAQEAIARASYERFMPKHITNLVLQSPGNLKIGGSSQLVTILFADIRNFTSLAEQHDPELVVRVLNRFFTAMTEILFANSGTLDKYLGDGLMAFFGAPYGSSDDAVNAVNAAVAMQRRLTKLNSEIQRMGFPAIEIGIGINTGEVTVGFIGSEQRTEYTAIGNTVTLANRLMSQAKGREILISDSTRQLIGNVFRTIEVGTAAFKGISTPTTVYRITYK